MAYLDNNGVLYLWGKIKSHVSAAINAIVIPSKTSELTNDSGFITSADVPEGASASTTTPKMDGTAAVGSETAFARGDHVHPSDTSKVDTSTFNTTVQSVQSAFGNYYTKTETDTAFGAFTTQLANKANKTDIASMYKYKGTVSTVSDLPSSDQSVGDVYNVESTGMNYAWNGSAWDALGESFQITAITNAELDSICT